MNEFEQAFKEYASLERRYKFINYETDIFLDEKEVIEELLYHADWEKETIEQRCQDELELDLEGVGRSDKQIQAMKDRAVAALDKFIDKWTDKGYKIG